MKFCVHARRNLFLSGELSVRLNCEVSWLCRCWHDIKKTTRSLNLSLKLWFLQDLLGFLKNINAMKTKAAIGEQNCIPFVELDYIGHFIITRLFWLLLFFYFHEFNLQSVWQNYLLDLKKFSSILCILHFINRTRTGRP